jgi:hypothetical protein
MFTELGKNLENTKEINDAYAEEVKQRQEKEKEEQEQQNK